MERRRKRKAVSTTGAPAAIGPYSQGVLVGSPSALLFVSGQIPLDAATGRMVAGDIAAETRQVLENVRQVVEAAGFGMEQVVKATIFLTDMGDFPAVNEEYARCFPIPYPARATVAVSALPKGARVEIEVVCAR